MDPLSIRNRPDRSVDPRTLIPYFETILSERLVERVVITDRTAPISPLMERYGDESDDPVARTP